MKLLQILPLATLGSAFVLPEAQVFDEVSIENHDAQRFLNHAKGTFQYAWDTTKDTFNDVVSASKSALDDALYYTSESVDTLNGKIHEVGYDVDGWLQGSFNNIMDADIMGGGEHPPHHGPHHPPHKKPHHPPHHHKPNMTVYELIAKSKYTTKLAALINDDEDLVKLLNGTKANYTVFAPIDRAFEKIPEDAPKPSKEMIRKLISYHVSDDIYPAGRVLHTHTIPSLLKLSTLGKELLPQRLAINVGFKGLTVNFYSRVVAIDIFGTNGVIHAVDSLIIPPPTVLEIIDLLPTEFSTLELGLGKTGLTETLNTTAHAGGTFFAPSNFAFKKLGPRINAFLFSKYGTKYLKALLEYHVVVNQTLYSDAFYDGTKESSEEHKNENGLFHFDFPTLLKDRTLSVDVGRYGPFISIKVNGFSRVTVQDGVAKDGVIQVVSDVLIPPKQTPGGASSFWQGEEMELDDFKERLEPYVKHEWEDL